MLRCYILDDEQHAVDALTAMLQKKFARQAEVCGSNIRATLAIDEIDQLQPDLLFLDVEMPEMTGLEVLKHFPERKFQIIFTTAHEKYALPALKAEAADYLVKPLSPQDVFDAIQKCLNKKGNTAPGKGRLTLVTAQEMLLVNTDDIIRIEASNNYSHFYFTNRPKVIVSRTLKEFDDQLNNQQFYRVHQSHLVNLKHVESIHSNDGDYAIMTGGHRVEISRRKKPEFLQLLKKN